MINDDIIKDYFKDIIEPEQPEGLTDIQLMEMLKHKNRNIMLKLHSNIKIGFGFLALYIFVVVASYFYMFMDSTLVAQLKSDMGWIFILDGCVDFFIIFSFIRFAKKYFGIEKQNETGLSIKETLENIISILSFYKRLFTIGFGLSIVSTASGMIWGILLGVKQEIVKQGINPEKQIIVYSIAIIFGFLFMFILFELVWYIFRALYGKYLKSLKENYKELIETE